ncbi:MAG: ankyrin repeat domain-containing protein [Coxiellaceae bacterium]|nr:ankyrin repeat domain-containing protein [Coxiellaceae bacterium]
MSLANAIISGDTQLAARYLQAGAPLNELDEYGYPPIIEATIADDVNMAEFLIGYHPNVNQQDLTGGTALHWAAENANIKMCELLLTNGANPNAYTTASEPVLVKPYLREQREVMMLLRERGASLQFAQDFVNAKLLGHRYDLVGQVDIVDADEKFTEVDFEGFFLESSLDIIRQSLQDHQRNFAAKHLREHFDRVSIVIDALSRARELIRYQHYQTQAANHAIQIKRLINHDLVIIPVGYQGHAITLVKYGNYLAICNRRRVNAFADHLAIGRMGRPNLFNYDLIKKCLYEKSSAHFIETQLPALLDLQPVTRLMLKRQISGNCSWANVEAAIPLSLFYLTQNMNEKMPPIIARDHPAIKFYRQWEEWDKDRALQFCMQDFHQASPARKASKAAQMAAVLFQRCGAKYQKDIQRAKRIIKLLKDTEYDYVISNYIQSYSQLKRTNAGKNLLKLLDLKDDPFAGDEAL